MGKWSDIPGELIESLEEYLDFVDKVRIRAVCTSWNSYLYKVPKLISEELPWLLLEDSTKGASLYSIHEAKLYPLNLPEIKHKIFKGSSYGWVITLEDESSTDIDEIYAVNPLTRDRIKLPPRSAFPDVKDFNPRRVGEEYIMNEPEPEPEPRQDEAENLIYYVNKRCANQYHLCKVILSSSPINDDCMAVAIYGEFCQLAWCRPHQKQWTSFFNFSRRRPHNGVSDILFHNDKLHALYGDGKLEIYESIDPHMTFLQVVIDVPPTVVLNSAHHLAVCPNLGLVLISQSITTHKKDGIYTIDTDWIFLYKLVESSWVHLEGLGEHISCLGLNRSSLIPVSDEFKALGYKRNCVYYTDNYVFTLGHDKQDDTDMGVFDLDDSFTIGLPGFEVKPEFFWPPPIWVTPSAI